MMKRAESTIVEKCKNLYNMNGYIDLLINPDIFCNDLGLTCTCLKDEETLERIAYDLYELDIYVMQYSDGIIRIEDRKHCMNRRLKNTLFWTVLFLSLAGYVAIFM